jgi:hypothetical protein
MCLLFILFFALLHRPSNYILPSIPEVHSRREEIARWMSNHHLQVVLLCYLIALVEMKGDRVLSSSRAIIAHT